MDENNNYINNFAKSKILPSNRVSLSIPEKEVNDEVIEVHELTLEKDKSIKVKKIDKKANKPKKSEITEEITVPDDPGITNDEEIHEP